MSDVGVAHFFAELLQDLSAFVGVDPDRPFEGIFGFQ